jgi:hypothetical protein
MSSVNDLEHMEIDVYQRLTRATAVYPNADTGDIDALAYVTLGLAGEAGEIANKVKKIIRDDAGVARAGHLAVRHSAQQPAQARHASHGRNPPGEWR